MSRKRAYGEGFDDRLRRLAAQGASASEAARELGCCSQTVRKHAQAMDVGLRSGRQKWTPERDAELKGLLDSGMGVCEAARAMGVPAPTVSWRRSVWEAEGPVRTGRWSDEDDERLLQMAAEGKRTADIAAELGRSYAAVSNRRSVRTAEPGVDHRRTWSDEDEGRLAALYLDGGTMEAIAEAMGRTASQVANKLAEMRRRGVLKKRAGKKAEEG